MGAVFCFRKFKKKGGSVLTDIIGNRQKGQQVAQILDIPHAGLSDLQGIGERVVEIREEGGNIIIVAKKR
jgi:orotate phosphoribosyltransferase